MLSVIATSSMQVSVAEKDAGEPFFALHNRQGGMIIILFISYSKIVGG